MMGEIQVTCKYCGQVNSCHTDAITDDIRCTNCRLPLSKEDHLKFTNLDPHTYIHPLDSQALRALKVIPGIDTILKTFIEFTNESILRIIFSANSVRVSENQCSDLNAKLEIACKTLGVEKPELYLSVTNPLSGSASLGFNAFTSGVSKPFIVLFSPLIERLNDKEILAVLAHELGHIHCNHLLYKIAAEILFVLTHAAIEALPLPFAITSFVTFPVRLALFTWYQKSELSCDRAAQLVVQDAQVITSLMTKLAGGTLASKINHEEFIKQAREFDRNNEASFIDSFWTTILASNQTHPFPVWRVSEILKWTEDPTGYQKIVESQNL